MILEILVKSGIREVNVWKRVDEIVPHGGNTDEPCQFRCDTNYHTPKQVLNYRYVPDHAYMKPLWLCDDFMDEE